MIRKKEAIFARMKTIGSADKIELLPMTRRICHLLFKEWENDEATFADASLFRRYVCSEEAVDRYFEKTRDPSRASYAIMLGNRPIGEVQLKHIDREKKECTVGIHMQNDAFKGRGYGTEALRLALRLAFCELGMRTVLADALRGNIRSRHVLEKIGFEQTGEDETFAYYSYPISHDTCFENG